MPGCANSHNFLQVSASKIPEIAFSADISQVDLDFFIKKIWFSSRRTI